jgi:hypothetical protein
LIDAKLIGVSKSADDLGKNKKATRALKEKDSSLN